MRVLALIATLVLASLADAVAQEQPAPLSPGQRVRVTAPSYSVNKLQATFKGFRGDTLVTEALVCPLSDVTRLEVVTGKKSFGVLQGAGIGLMIGAPIGALLGGQCVGGFGECDSERGAVQGALRSGLAGAVIGGIVGALTRRDRWEEVPLGGVRVDVVAQRGGVGIGARIAF